MPLPPCGPGCLSACPPRAPPSTLPPSLHRVRISDARPAYPGVFIPAQPLPGFTAQLSLHSLLPPCALLPPNYLFIPSLLPATSSPPFFSTACTLTC
eukprot:362385-Chlamydomonas_euryale.AAC.3